MPYELQRDAPVSSMQSSAKQAIVVGMTADSEPHEAIGGFDGEGSVAGADPCRPVTADSLEVQ